MTLADWLLADLRLPKGIHSEAEATHPWWRVMCLTGVDYFSTLGYQPGIAFLAAGVLSPLATLILVLVTLFGALPVYSRVAEASPNGQGSIGMLEKLFPQWSGKTFVLDSAGLRNHRLHHHHDSVGGRRRGPPAATIRSLRDCMKNQMLVTLVLLAVLGAIFLKGFKEAIGIAVVLVGAYLALERSGRGRRRRPRCSAIPEMLPHWKQALFAQHGESSGDARHLARPVPEAGPGPIGV